MSNNSWLAIDVLPTSLAARLQYISEMKDIGGAIEDDIGRHIQF